MAESHGPGSRSQLIDLIRKLIELLIILLGG